jgi:hypothetical protein
MYFIFGIQDLQGQTQINTNDQTFNMISMYISEQYMICCRTDKPFSFNYKLLYNIDHSHRKVNKQTKLTMAKQEHI